MYSKAGYYGKSMWLVLVGLILWMVVSVLLRRSIGMSDFDITMLLFLETITYFCIIGVILVVIPEYSQKKRMRVHSRLESRSYEQHYDLEFHSLTKCLSDGTVPEPNCPECGEIISFKQALDWMGPSAFVCPNCGQVVELDELNLD
ncbi:MAG: hypothetical protein EAX95_07305 [Candidatus Thorarchaeota archaeon]|nr:hypothetical protein [Candidatus Thorarchaeota archaeon]